MPFSAVLFDLDGTLLDTLDDLADATNAVLAARGWPTHPTEAYKTFVGNGAVKLIERALPDDVRSQPDRLVDVVAEFKTQYARCWKAKTRPYDGVAELLAGLSERGLKMAVLSNKPHEFTVLCVDQLLSDWTFDAIQGVADHVPPKPDTTGCRRIAESLGVPAEGFVYLGDTNTDMQTATRAGMFAVGATWGFRPAEELRDAGADRLIDHPTTLLDLLD